MGDQLPVMMFTAGIPLTMVVWLLLVLAAFATADTTVEVDWNTTEYISRTTTTLQVSELFQSPPARSHCHLSA
jgi:predicted RND superfamily exporter protein